ncbi:glycosyltransferase family protein [Promicromonospora sp. CA-289599]|uniref:glycosyltransferase family protein n=1 Tax=Promicromonospora sp. CA-289599 TaxID=3240014 RepID=UPI003D92CD22
MEWYQCQAGRTFADRAEAVSHYVEEGRRAGWSPHPLFLPARFDPRRWDSDETDPLVAYLEGADGAWEKSTSPLFDPARAHGSRRPDRAPLASLLEDGDPQVLPLAPDAGWLRDGITLLDVREAMRAHAGESADEEAASWRSGPAADTVPGLMSVVVADCASTPEVLAALGAIDPVTRATAGRPAQSVEVVLLVPDEDRRVSVGLALASLARWEVRVVSVSGPAGTVAAITSAAHGARGEHTLLMSARNGFRRGTLADWRTAFSESGAAAVHPLVLTSRHLVSDAGVVYPPYGKDPVPFLGGMHPDSVVWPAPRFSVPGAPVPLLARTESVRAALGDDEAGDLWADISLSQRLAVQERRPVVVVPDLVGTRAAAAGTFDSSPQPEEDLLAFRTAWRQVPSGSADLFRTFGVSPVFLGVSALSAPENERSWTRALWLPAGAGHGATVVESPPSLRWAIKIAAPSADRARQWGDFHFANSLADALRALGQRAVVDHRLNDARYSSYADDVVLTLRGLFAVTLPTNVTSVAWVISHPDAVTARELENYDLRYAASPSWARDVSSTWGQPVRPLLQCTDPSRFYIDDEPVPEVVGKALFVGNSRGEARPVVMHTVASGTPIAVYGEHWEEFLPPEAIAGTYVPNEILRRYYRSAAWALNDHWADMRDLGFVSNRVFDVLASGGRLLTDDIDGLDEITRTVLPERGLARFRTVEDLDAAFAGGSGAWYDDTSLRALSDHVRKEHSFGARAQVLLEGVLAHRASASVGASRSS